MLSYSVSSGTVANTCIYPLSSVAFLLVLLQEAVNEWQPGGGISKLVISRYGTQGCWHFGQVNPAHVGLTLRVVILYMASMKPMKYIHINILMACCIVEYMHVIDEVGGVWERLPYQYYVSIH